MTKNRHTYYVSDQFIIRRPYYDFRTCIDALNDSEVFEQLIASPDFLEAILISSPELYYETKKLIDKTLIPKESLKLRKTLAKYIIRMSVRSTPFGRFALCGTGYFTDATKIAQTTHIGNIFKIGYEMEQHLCKTFLLQHTKKFQKLRFVRNQTIYISSSTIHYMSFNNDGIVVNKTIKPSRVIKFVIDVFQEPRAYNEGLLIIRNEFDISEKDYAQLICDLVSESLIIPEFVSEIDDLSLSQIEKFISSAISKDPETEKIEDIIKTTYNLNILEDTADRIEEIKKFQYFCESLNTHIQPKRWLRSDSFLFESSTLNKSLKKTISECLDIFSRLNTERTSAMESFISIFSARYELEKQPLLEVLDPNLGIGYGNQASGYHPLLNELDMSNIKNGSNHIVRINLTPYEQCIQKKIRQENMSCHSLEFSKADFPPTTPHAVAEHYPSVACMFKYVGKEGNEEIISDIEFCGPSACNLISRFAYGNRKIYDLCIEICKKEQEQDPNYLYCEISHLASDHVGNISHRPIIRDRNCYFMTFPISCNSETIDLSDIYVYCKGQKLFLWSKKHNKNLRFMLTTAFNHHYKTAPLYQFIGDMQNNGINEGMSLTINNLLELYDHVPQIRYKNIILSKESWVMRFEDLAPDGFLNIDTIRKFLRNKELPRFFSYKEGDNFLVFDYDSTPCIELLIDFLKSKKTMILEEYLPLKSNINTTYANVEIITPILKT